MLIDNPIATGAYVPEIAPDIVCPACSTEWYSGIQEAVTYMSASGKRCYGCIDDLDSHAMRIRWLEATSDYADYLKYAFGGTDAMRYVDDAQRMYKALKAGVPDFVDDTLHDYVLKRKRAEYRQWMLDNN